MSCGGGSINRVLEDDLVRPCRAAGPGARADAVCDPYADPLVEAFVVKVWYRAEGVGSKFHASSVVAGIGAKEAHLYQFVLMARIVSGSPLNSLETFELQCSAALQIVVVDMVRAGGATFAACKNDVAGAGCLGDAVIGCGSGRAGCQDQDGSRCFMADILE